MRYCLLVKIVILFVSCKSLVHNDNIISYQYIGEKSNLNIIGDFQEIPFSKGDKIRIMPAYFREYGSLENSIVVNIGVDKKYAFMHLGAVVSKEFGPLKKTPREWPRKSSDFDNVVFSKPLKEMDLLKRKQRILKDTITVKFGQKEFKFAPKQKSSS